MDRGKDHQEMPVEKKVQEDVDSSVSLRLHLKRRNRLQPTTKEAADVCENGGLLGGRIPNYSQLFHEEQVHRRLSGNQTLHLPSPPLPQNAALDQDQPRPQRRTNQIGQQYQRFQGIALRRG